MENINYRYILISILWILIIPIKSHGQAPTCQSTVPFYVVDLTSSPNGTWTSPSHSRVGGCCNGGNNCTSFKIMLNPNTVAVNFDIASGAVPTGVMYYQIDCGTQVPVGSQICVTGSGAHYLTFCKPGNNENTYKITGISKPLFPADTVVRKGCSRQFTVQGVTNNTITWTSISPGAPGQYNSYLSSTTSLTPTFTPASNAPANVKYRICGFPVASMCGYNVTVCDTLSIDIKDFLTGNASPNPASFCNTGPGSGVTLTGQGVGGNGTYSYIWRNNTAIVGTNKNYFASSQESYSLEIRDGLFNQVSCPAAFVSVPVTQSTLPIVDAGPDQSVCSNDPQINLNGSVQNASGGTWSGGAGSFTPSNNILNATYWPTQAEINAGSVDLILKSNNVNGCPQVQDVVHILITSPPNVTVTKGAINCDLLTTVLNVSASGGVSPYTYRWNNGSNGTSITIPAGNYCVDVTDNVGCRSTVCQNVTQPQPLSLIMGSTPVSIMGALDGTATTTLTGGTPPISYQWNNSGTSQSIIGLPFGIYTVNVKDVNGCTIKGSVVVNNPLCLGFNATISHTNLSCYGATNASATVVASGGLGGYTYQWNDPLNQTTATATNLAAGTYTVTVTSGLCVYTANVTIPSPAPLVNTFNYTDVTNQQSNNGSITVNPFGGTPGYTYLWNTGATTQSISNLSPGNYSVIITDSKGCKLTDNFTLQQQVCSEPRISALGNQPSCFGMSDGSANVYINSGSPPYSILWSTGGTSSSITNVPAGSYSVSVTDASGCTTTRNLIVTQPNKLTLGLAPTPISCFGKNDGTIEGTVSGGLYPYSYNWSNGITVEDLIYLGPGGYSLTVTDAKGCITFGSTTVTEPAQLTASYTNNNVTCNGGTNGNIDLSVSGGMSPYTYNWSNGSTTQDLNNIPSGIYQVSIHDLNECTLSSSLNINIIQPSAVKIDSITSPCPTSGSNQVHVTVYPSGGSGGPYQISFNNGTSYLAKGKYDTTVTAGNTFTIKVNDINGCTLPAGQNLTINPVVDIQNSVTFNKCFTAGTTQTLVSVTPEGGDGGSYKVSFNNGSTFEPAGTYSKNLAIGNTYNLIVKDGKGCTSAQIPAVIPSRLVATINAKTLSGGFNISCNGSNNGSAKAIVTGGTTPYVYAWTGPSGFTSSSDSIGGLSAGTYTLTVTDAFNCTSTATFNITQPNPFTIGTTTSSQSGGFNISCHGANNGFINLNVSGGDASTYTYAWTGPNGFTSNQKNLTSLYAGTYTVVVTDANGCIATTSVTLTEPAGLTVDLVASNKNGGYNISCHGASDGFINLNVSGGDPSSYTFHWTGPNGFTSNQMNLTGLKAGTYTLTVTDANGCSAPKSITLTEPGTLTVAAGVSNHSGGFNISCNGATDGFINLNVSGGDSTSYHFAWTGPNGFTSTQKNLTGLVAGTYTITVTDANGCSASKSITLTQPNGLTIGATTSTASGGFNISCHGGNNGFINLTISGGDASSYTFAWTGPNGFTSNQKNITGLFAGTYDVVVKDANGCTATKSITLTEPNGLNVAFVLSNKSGGDNVSCNGSKDGTITLNVTGGDASTYTFHWTGPNGFTSNQMNLTNLGAGTYTLSVTDANGCSAPTSITLTQPDTLTIGSVLSNHSGGYNISCNGATDGFINLNVKGGDSTSYHFAWTGPNGFTSNQKNLTGLVAGTYTVSVTDANACSASKSITLTQPDSLAINPLLSSASGGSNISCNGANDGFINLNVTGGDASTYSYAWTGPNGFTSNQKNLTGIGAGTYTILVTDANGCSKSKSITLTQPDSLSSSPGVSKVSGGSNLSCHGAKDGFINLKASGGDSTSYSYAWTGPNGFTSNQKVLTGLEAGAYTVIIKDANGCTTSKSIALNQPDSLVIDPLLSNNSGGKNISCNGASDGFVKLNVRGGDSTTYTYTWTGPNGFTSNQKNLTGLAAGTYTIKVTDANGCSATQSITFTQPDSLTIGAIKPNGSGGFNISCNGASDGFINLNVQGGDPSSYHFAWTGPNGFTSNQKNLTGLAAGTYTIVVSDANGCSKTQSVTLIQPDSLTIDANVSSVSGGNNISCNGGTNGFINLTVKGGDSTTYTYAWNGPNGFFSNHKNLTNLAAGTYTVEVTDNNGCKKSKSITLTQPDALTISPTTSNAQGGYNISCHGSSDGFINLNVSGGDSSTYTFAWTGPNGFTSNQKNLTGLAAGTYNVVVSDANGCTATQSTTLTQPDSLTSAATVGSDYNGNGVSCFGSSDGAASVTAAGGAGPYTYLWNNGSTNQNIQNVPAGIYSVTVTDANGCKATASTTITQPDSLHITSNNTNVLCNGFPTGAIDLSHTGGTGPFTYLWSDGETTQDIAHLNAGSYQVAITDKNNCVYHYTTQILEEKPVLTSVASTNETCHESNNGSITVTPSGGVTPYSITWSNGMTGFSLTGLPAGTYISTVKDNNNCFRNDTTVITQPDSLQVEVTSPVKTNGTNTSFFNSQDGELDATVAGGTPPYNYQWSTGATIQDVTGVGAGNYTVTVTDSHGCTNSAITSVTQPAFLALPTGYSPNNDGKNDNFVVKGIEAYPNNKLVVVNRWGNTVFQAQPYSNNWNGKNSSGENLPDDTYFVVFTVNDEEITLKGYVDLRRK